MVRTPGFHPEDPGSIPHAGDFFKILILIHIIIKRLEDNKGRVV